MPGPTKLPAQRHSSENENADAARRCCKEHEQREAEPTCVLYPQRLLIRDVVVQCVYEPRYADPHVYVYRIAA